MAKPARVVVSKDGPYVVTGNVRLSRQIIGTDSEGGSETWIEGEIVAGGEKYSLCRCGHSKKKPFCDGTHTKIGFDGNLWGPDFKYTFICATDRKSGTLGLEEAWFVYKFMDKFLGEGLSVEAGQDS